MKREWLSNVLSVNVKNHRAEHGLSQKEFAEKAGCSYRLVQEIEGGAGNPTTDTLGRIARAFRVTVQDLLSLSHLRLIDGDGKFVDRFQDYFSNSEIGAGLRHLNGVAIWANKVVDKIHGGHSFQKGPVDLLEYYSVEVRGLIKTQLAAEKNGIAYPYTIAHLNPKSKEPLFLRCRPTLILPAKGKTPVYTAVYISEIANDCTVNYYEYCATLLKVTYST